ncbi:MAG TPA: hypothetical protein VNZ45_03975 [Bacteroidia bacterium]|jgi:hypothetical protein|nr:hypothetical protein [Bacteroidia bacterium]
MQPIKLSISITKYFLTVFIVIGVNCLLHAQSSVGKQSTEMTKSPKEAMKEKKALDKIHERDQAALGKNAQKSKYKSRFKYKAPKQKDKTDGGGGL